jgi:hypothetical protein
MADFNLPNHQITQLPIGLPYPFIPRSKGLTS